VRALPSASELLLPSKLTTVPAGTLVVAAIRATGAVLLRVGGEGKVPPPELLPPPQALSRAPTVSSRGTKWARIERGMGVFRCSEKRSIYFCRLND